MFTPQVGENLDEVEISESLELLKRGKNPFITVSLYNTSPKSVYVKKGTVLGSIYNVSAVIPVDLGKGDVDVSKDPRYKHEMLSKLDLNHLSEEKQNLVRKLLREELEVFALTKNDIGDVPDLEMKIKLLDDFPVCEPYRRIPRPFYEEVKAHITDLLINGWIQKSYSSLSSPMVCVRKKWGNAFMYCLTKGEFENHPRSPTFAARTRHFRQFIWSSMVYYRLICPKPTIRDICIKIRKN